LIKNENKDIKTTAMIFGVSNQENDEDDDDDEEIDSDDNANNNNSIAVMPQKNVSKVNKATNGVSEEELRHI
jgi:hypothetical protein